MSQPYTCPRCNSTNTRPFIKETHETWQGGLPKVFHYEKGEKLTFEEVECLDCGNRFPPQESEAGSGEEESDEEYEEEKEYEGDEES